MCLRDKRGEKENGADINWTAFHLNCPNMGLGGFEWFTEVILLIIIINTFNNFNEELTRSESLMIMFKMLKIAQVFKTEVFAEDF